MHNFKTDSLCRNSVRIRSHEFRGTSKVYSIDSICSFYRHGVCSIVTLASLGVALGSCWTGPLDNLHAPCVLVLQKVAVHDRVSKERSRLESDGCIGGRMVNEMNNVQAKVIAKPTKEKQSRHTYVYLLLGPWARKGYHANRPPRNNWCNFLQRQQVSSLSGMGLCGGGEGEPTA